MNETFKYIAKITSENILSIAEFGQKVESNGLDLEYERLLYYKKKIEQEANDVIQELKNYIQNTTDDKQIEQYIFKLINDIENIKDEIINELDINERAKIFRKPTEYKNSDIQKLAFQYLDNIQAFIEVNYSHYLKISSSISYSGKIKSTGQFKTLIKQLNSKFEFVNPELRKILSSFFMKISERMIDDYIQYKEFVYYNKVLTKLSNDEVNKDNVETILISLNLNSVRFFNYLTNKIKHEIDIEDNTVHKVDTLKYYAKIFKQKQLITSLSYNYSSPNIKEQVINWLLAEVEYYCSKIKLSQNTSYEDIISSEDKDDKIELSLSVPQISYFFRILHDIGIINNSNQHEIFRVLSKSLKTQKTENISIGSLSSKYYSIDNSAKNVVKDVVFQMLNYVNKNN